MRALLLSLLWLRLVGSFPCCWKSPIATQWNSVQYALDNDNISEGLHKDSHNVLKHSPNRCLPRTSTSFLLAELEKDLEKLSLLRPPTPEEDFSAPLTLISAGSSYTRLWTHKTWRAHSDPPHVRYARHVRKWSSSTTARKIFPAVLIATTWATLLCLVAKPYATSIRLAAPAAAVSFLAAPLALLLTLRANASMTRLLEARSLWGRLILHARSLSNAIKTYLFPNAPDAAILAVRHLCIMGWLLKASLRGEDEHSQASTILTLLDPKNGEWLLNQSARNVALTSRVRQICTAAISMMPEKTMASAVLLILEERVASLEQVVGGCERLFSSPIPPTYSRHLSRTIVLWLILMPMSLIAAGLSVLGTSLATAVASYVLIGIDEVGMEIEDCFQLLPLQQLAGAVQNHVKDQFILDMPPVPLPDASQF